jgi:hypothetical protein
MLMRLGDRIPTSRLGPYERPPEPLTPRVLASIKEWQERNDSVLDAKQVLALATSLAEVVGALYPPGVPVVRGPAVILPSEPEVQLPPIRSASTTRPVCVFCPHPTSEHEWIGGVRECLHVGADGHMLCICDPGTSAE